jgi:hypothetical protein
VHWDRIRAQGLRQHISPANKELGNGCQAIVDCGICIEADSPGQVGVRASEAIEPVGSMPCQTPIA